jgi:hypothetical protein
MSLDAIYDELFAYRAEAFPDDEVKSSFRAGLRDLIESHRWLNNSADLMAGYMSYLVELEDMADEDNIVDFSKLIVAIEEIRLERDAALSVIEEHDLWDDYEDNVAELLTLRESDSEEF